jgi:hypothetical protein
VRIDVVKRKQEGLSVTIQHLADVAARVSRISALAPDNLARIDDEHLYEYWSVARELLHRWSHDLSEFAATFSDMGEEQFAPAWAAARDTIEAVLLMDLTTRVWGSALMAAESRSNSPGEKSRRQEKIARGVLLSQAEARFYTLKLLLDDELGRRVDLPAVDRLRRRVERWTDLLLGHLVVRDEVVEFAFELERARDFGEEQLDTVHTPAGDSLWNLVTVGLSGIAPTRESSRIDAEAVGRLVRSILIPLEAGNRPPAPACGPLAAEGNSAGGYFFSSRWENN